MVQVFYIMLALLVMSVTASAQNHTRYMTLLGDTIQTGLSGRPGTEETRLFLEGGGPNSGIAQPRHPSMLTKISWTEQGDAPCAFEASGRIDVKAFEQCGRKRNKTGNDSSRKRLDAPSAFDHKENIRSLQVCLNRRKDRVKGLRIWGRPFHYQYPFTKQSEQRVEAKRTNCNNWAQKVNCPTDWLASGVVLSHVDGTISGIRLLCTQTYDTRGTVLPAGHNHPDQR